MKKPSLLDAVVAAAGGVLGVLLVRSLSTRTSSESPALLVLRRQINEFYPSRSKASDGILPSAAHREANPKSDHSRGDALDVTFDLLHGPNLHELAERLLADERVTYVIYDRRIANRSIDGGAWRPYAQTAIQTDPHTTHLHVSMDHDRRGNTSAWRIPDGVYAEPPPGYAHMSQSRVTPDLTTWAKQLLTDANYPMGMGETRLRDASGEILARAEMHPPDGHIPRRHRGVSLYELRKRVS